MTKIARIGVDTSKSVFQLHGVDEAEEVVLRRKLRRAQFLVFFASLEPTAIGMEACGASYHWARELRKLGHEVVLIPPQYVKAYVARGKNDAKDAEAICEAMSRPRVRKRLVAVKTEEQSAAQMLLGIREHMVKRRTQLSNTIRGYAAEFGIVVPKGLDKIEGLLGQLADDPGVPELAKEMFDIVGQEFAKLAPRLAAIERRLKAWHRANELSRRLAEVPTIGPIGACRMAITIINPKAFALSLIHI